MARGHFLALILAVATAGSGESHAGSAPSDPFFREALYLAYQDEHFLALERLDSELEQHYGVDERELDSLHADIGEAEFSIGDFELRYRMHQRAGRAIRAILESDVDDVTRADATYRLARLHYQKNETARALEILGELPEELPEELSHDVQFLRASILIESGRADEAAEILERLQGARSLEGFAAYNLGIARLESGDASGALRTFERTGTLRSDDQAVQAIRDRSNLLLGTLLFEAEEYGRARAPLDRIRLDGPYSNQALLRAGWVEVRETQLDRALVPWSILAKRDPTDQAVQEAFLALPFVYSKLSLHGRAATLYERAANSFADELAKIDASIESVENGSFLEALEGQEIRQDKDWIVRMRALPDAPETFYLVSLMASHEFQTALQNYIDLIDMRRSLVAARRSLEAFSDLIRIRREYYEPRIPNIDESFRRLDAQMRLRLEQRDHIAERIQKMLTAPAPRILAESSEQAISARLGALRIRIDSISDPGLRRRLATRADRLEGVLEWRIRNEYHERLTRIHRLHGELEADVETLEERYQAFVRIRQAALHSHVGYDEIIERLEERSARAVTRLDELKERQGERLEAVAARELSRRRHRLVEYQDKARFAFADSYDRALKAQAP